MDLSPDHLFAAMANAFDAFVRGGLADLRLLPTSIVDEGPQRTVRRYLPLGERPLSGPPVLLVPPLASPALCFDLRRGCSLAEHLLAGGHPTYLVDYGEIAFADRNLGLEHWIDDVLPNAIEAVSADAGGQPVQLVGWCLGGILSLLAVADRKLPVRSVTAIASPFDVKRVPMVAPLRPLINLAQGYPATPFYRFLGVAPAPIVKRVYQLAAIDKYVTKPLAVALNLNDREFLAQIEAVDRFTANMVAYPGRTVGQLYHRFFRANDLARGSIELGGRQISLDRVKQPVLSIAGADDGIAPRAAVHHLGELLPNAASVKLKTAPGGHLGVLTGRGARTTTWRYLDDFLAANGDRRRGGRRLRAVA
jgi:polyhydroxyalkanoate synthase subunit PhaC